MLTVLRRKFNRSVLSLIVLIGFLFCNPSMAQADKATKSVVFDSTSSVINIASIYETTAETQKDTVSSILKSSKSLYKKAPGFNSFSVFQSEDGTRVVALTQWQDADSYEAFLAQPVDDAKSSKSSKKEKEEKVAIEPLRTIAFEVDKTLAPAGMIPSIRGKDALVQFSELTAKNPEDLAVLIASAEDALSGTAQMYPAPRSAVLLKGVDSSDVALLANWGYAMEFDDLSQVPSVAVLSEDEATLADADEHLYEVVKIIAAKPEKEKDKD
jgi:heme-degrading monooxygenase HmoA